MTDIHPDFSMSTTKPSSTIGERGSGWDPVVSNEDVRRIRKHFGESQAQFARRIDVDTVTVARWETGQRKCTGMYANRVALLDPEGNTVLRDFLTKDSKLSDFTNRALKAILLAQSEAHRFGSTWLGTEHLLLGLIGEGEGTAALCFKTLGIDFLHASLEVELLNGWGRNTIILEEPLSARVLSLLDLPSPQARFHALNFGIPCSPKFEEVLAKANELAKDNHGLGTGHLLLALLQTEKCAGVSILTNTTLNLTRIKDLLSQMMKTSEGRHDRLSQSDVEHPVSKTEKSTSTHDSLASAAGKLQEASRVAFLWQDYNLANWIRDCEAGIRRKLLQQHSNIAMTTADPSP